MGVPLLFQASDTQSIHGKPALQSLDGKILAVDLALWIVQGIEQRAEGLTETFATDESRVLKTIFERVCISPRHAKLASPPLLFLFSSQCINWARCGALPVFIIESKQPAAKKG